MKIRITSLLILVLVLQCISMQAYARGHVERTGDALMLLIPISGLGASLIYETDRDGTIHYVKSFAASQVTTDVLKVVTHKRRPNGSCCLSFPSGHTSAAFMGAAFIDQRYGWQYAILAYIGASYVGYSRIYADKHYGIDVVAGAAIGIISSYYFTERYDRLHVTPLVMTDGVGLQLSWSL